MEIKIAGQLQHASGGQTNTRDYTEKLATLEARRTVLSGAVLVTAPASVARVFLRPVLCPMSLLSNHNEAYFNNLTVQMIFTGITKQREVTLVNIQKKLLLRWRNIR